MRVVGVDGCRQGWVAIVLDDARFASASVARRFADLLAEIDDAAVFGVDIPVGLLDRGWRDCDHAARDFLGNNRRASVFTTPPRSVLAAESHREASDLAQDLLGKGISQQSFALAHKILEVDRVADDRRIYEVHPEVAFQVLAERPLPHTKKTWGGLADRRALLEGAGIHLPVALGPAEAVAPDDVLDAAVVAWSAHRIATGAACSFPAAPEQRDRGRPIAIWA